MERIITNNVWSKISRSLKKGHNKFAAIAYVSKGTPLSFENGDTLVCDASDQAIKSGETDAQTLKKFLKAGARLYSCPNLHAKILISKDMVVIGSANLSLSSESRLVEACLVTTRYQIRSQASAFIYNLIKVSTSIDDIFIDHISSLPVTRQFRLFPHKKPKIKETGSRFWVINTSILKNYPAEEDTYIERGIEEARKVIKDPDAEVSWVRWIAKDRFRKLAKQGDTVIEIINYKNRATVTSPYPILFRQDHKTWTRFYFGEPDSEISWTSFDKKLKNVGLRKIKKTSIRELNQRDIDLTSSIW